MHILTHIIREGPKDGEPSRGPAGPLYGVHVDQSVWAAQGVAHRWLGDEADELLAKPRYQIINVSRNLPYSLSETKALLTSCISRLAAVEASQADHT